MTEDKATYTWFSSFGLPAFPTGSVPDDQEYPWITYDYVQGDRSSGDISFTAMLWYHTKSEAVPNAKADEIYEAVKDGGAEIDYDGGRFVIMADNLFSQSMIANEDNTEKCRYLQFIKQYL